MIGPQKRYKLTKKEPVSIIETIKKLTIFLGQNLKSIYIIKFYLCFLNTGIVLRQIFII